MSKLRVTLVRSRIKADKHQAKVLDGLGLRKINGTKELEDTPAVRGMVRKVEHMVTVESV